MRPRFTRRASCDLEDIADYIAKGSTQRARTYVAQLRQQCERIAAFPLSHPLRDDIGPGLRSCPHEKYVIIYRIGKTCVHILRVVSASRDIAALF